MDRKIPDLKSRLYLGAAVVLLVGLCAAALIYLTAGEGSNSAEAYVLVDGVVYPVDLSHTKAYVHQLQHFGGKTAVLFDEIDRWFEGLWQGKSLGITVAWISVLVSLGIFLFASTLPSAPNPEARSEDDRDAPAG